MYRAPTKSLRSAFGRAGLKPRPYNRENRKSTGLKARHYTDKEKGKKGHDVSCPYGMRVCEALFPGTRRM